MSSNAGSDIRHMANTLSGHIKELQRVHREMDRVGRVFRDIWSYEIADLLTKAANPTTLTDEETASIDNYRDSGRNALQWAELGTALHRLHIILESDEPESDDQDPSVTSDDIAVITVNWLSGGNTSEDPLNTDLYNMALSWSRLIFEVEYDLDIYDVKIKHHIEAITSDIDEDGYTGRTKEVWVNAINGLAEIVKVMFGELSDVANDQGKYLNAF